MILRSILLEDFGLYAGSTRLDLVPRRRRGYAKPIVLIGGQNGAGKTTLLEAVRLALYGRRALGTRVGQSEYEQYLRCAVHRSGSAHTAAVGVEFDYAESGVVHRYRVRREWRLRDKSVTETLHVDKDGATVSSVPRQEWHYFLQELIPPGVSQLFFFDGEKIREIADEDQDNEHLAEAVRALLGIELVARLRTDVGLFIARHQARDEPSGAEELENVLRQIAELQRQSTELTEKIADLNTVRDSQARVAEQVRRRFVSEGGDVALRRARVESQRDELIRRAAQIQHDLQHLAGALLPLAVAPRLLKSFRDALRKASGGRDDPGTADRLRKAVQAWRKDDSSRHAKWNDKHWTDLAQFLKSWKQKSPNGPLTLPAFLEIGDPAAALARFAEVEAVTRPRAVTLTQELEDVTSRLEKTEAALLRADAAAAGILLEELSRAEQRLGATEAALHMEQQELQRVRGQLVTLDRDRRRLLEAQARSAAASGRLALAGKVTDVLAEYEQRLLEQKLAQLRREFVAKFNLLARKAEFISDARIDPETFATTLIDCAGKEVPKASLSAGEKQIYAIAMLWALARTSERPLPMIIDTPLARLDSEHRANLIERYFPAASHQVVLLSTDTELDVRLLQALGDSVSHTYRLDYDPSARSTVASPGYFGEQPQRERRRAL